MTLFHSHPLDFKFQSRIRRDNTAGAFRPVPKVWRDHKLPDLSDLESIIAQRGGTNSIISGISIKGYTATPPYPNTPTHRHCTTSTIMNIFFCRPPISHSLTPHPWTPHLHLADSFVETLDDLLQATPETQGIAAYRGIKDLSQQPCVRAHKPHTIHAYTQ